MVVRMRKVLAIPWSLVVCASVHIVVLLALFLRQGSVYCSNSKIWHSAVAPLLPQTGPSWAEGYLFDPV